MAKVGGTYVVERNHSDSNGKVFRSAKSGQFMTTVMSKSTYGSASAKANSAIKTVEEERSRKAKT